MNPARVEELLDIAGQTGSRIARETMSFVCRAYSIFKEDFTDTQAERNKMQTSNETEGNRSVTLPSHNILTADQLADVLQVSESSIYKWAEAGKIPSHKIGESLRFVLDEVLKATHNEAQFLITETKPKLNKRLLKAVK